MAEEAAAFGDRAGYPAYVRPASLVVLVVCKSNEEELREIAENGLKLSPVTQCLIKRLYRWFQRNRIRRDAADNALVVCNMENFDPVGIHTGEFTSLLQRKHCQILKPNAS